MKTLLLDTNFVMGSADHSTFVGTDSVFDYDVVIWDPEGTSSTYDGVYRGKFRGRPAPTEAESVVLLEALDRRRKEFIDFLALGRSLVIIASPPQPIWVDTGKKETSGTGRNQKVTRLLSDVDLLAAVPLELRTIAGRGSGLRLTSPIGASLWNGTRGLWTYRCYLDKFPGTALLEVDGAQKVVASVEVTDAGGVLALLPEPWIPDDSEDDDDEDEAEGTAAPADIDDSETDGYTDVPSQIIAWVYGLGGNQPERPPIWAKQFRFESERKREQEMVRLEKSMARLTRKIDALKLAQAEDDRWKSLSFGSGSSLEDQTRRAFELLGFEVLQAQRGRSDLRLDHEGNRVVVEIKGLSKSAGERNAAQLEKWVAEELAEDIVAKGILVVNTWREIAPDSREVSFPSQMLPYAASRGHCLLTTLQLLSLARRVSEGTLDAAATARLLLSTVGAFEATEAVLTQEADAAD